MLRKLLEEIGLSSSEAEVYLASLRLGTQDIATLSKETKLPALDVSVLLTGLLDRGFVSKFSREKDFFTPEQPAVVVRILENGKLKLESSISKLKKHLPEFEDFMNPSFTKPEIAFYEGTEGIVAAYEDTLSSHTEILAIFTDTKMSRARQKHDTEELRDSRLLPKDLLNIEIEINIYDDKVAYFSLPEKLAVIAKSKLIAASMRQMFELAWKMADMYQMQQALEPKKGKQLTRASA